MLKGFVGSRSTISEGECSKISTRLLDFLNFHFRLRFGPISTMATKMTTPNGTKIGENFGKMKGAKTTGTAKSNLNISCQFFRIAVNPKVLAAAVCVESAVNRPKRKCLIRWIHNLMIAQSFMENKSIQAFISGIQLETNPFHLLNCNTETINLNQVPNHNVLDQSANPSEPITSFNTALLSKASTNLCLYLPSALSNTLSHWVSGTVMPPNLAFWSMTGYRIEYFAAPLLQKGDWVSTQIFVGISVGIYRITLRQTQYRQGFNGSIRVPPWHHLQSIAELKPCSPQKSFPVVFQAINTNVLYAHVHRFHDVQKYTLKISC